MPIMQWVGFKKENSQVYRSIILLLLVSASCVSFGWGCASQADSVMAIEMPASTDMESEYGEASYAEAPLLADSGSLQPVLEPEIDPAQTKRLVVYNGVMNVVVERITDSINQIKAAVTAMGGYMQEMSSNSITLKIPAKRFQDALAEAEKLGEVARKEIKGTDVTEEMRDLNIRLGNAEQVRDRLIKLLDRAGKVEEALKIEKELARITESIELLKGKIAYLKNSVAFCTLTVHFNSPIPQQDISRMTPFGWVHELGGGLTRRAAHQPYERSSFMSKGMFSLPDGYVRYYQDKRRARAMSAAGVMIDVHKEKNYKGGSVGFWGDLVRRVLVEQKVFHLKEDLKLNPKGKTECLLLAGSKQIGAKQFGYLVGLAASKKYVHVFEAWGPLQELEEDREKLMDAIKSMRLR